MEQVSEDRCAGYVMAPVMLAAEFALDGGAR
jgi:hypothetical protein